MIMNREQFIASLRRELKKLPPEEIVAASEYYEEYFDDALAGVEESQAEDGVVATAGAATAREAAEAQLIEELGSPKTIAAHIKSEYASRVLTGDETTLKYKPTVGNKISAVWWILLGVLAAPVGIPVAIALGAVIFALLITVFAVIISFYCAAIGIFVGGIALLAAAIAAITTSFFTALMLLGAGLVLLALAVLIGVGLTMLVKLLIQVPGRLARNSNKNGGTDHE